MNKLFYCNGLAVMPELLLSATSAEAWRKCLDLPHPMVTARVALDKLKNQLDRDGEARIAATYLTGQEQTQLAGYRHLKRKLEWLGGRLAAKTAVMRLLSRLDPKNSLTWQNLPVVADTHGKPFVRLQGDISARPVEISISHSDNLAVALATLETPCGIDIQKIGASVVKVKDRFSTISERELLDASLLLAERNEENRLTLLWSAKEAFRKAFGVTPLPGFMELRLDHLADCSGQGLRLDFTYLKNARRLTAVACFHDDFAVAITGGDTGWPGLEK